MKIDPTILTEIEEISPLLASLRGVNVFIVPDGYFDTLTEDIRERVVTSKMAEYGQSDFTLGKAPEGYFENLSSDILRKIKEADDSHDEELYPLLARCRGKNVFITPEGYFETFSSGILDRVKQNSGGKVVPIFRGVVFRYAVAAVVAIGLFAAAFFTFTQKNSGNSNSFAVVNKYTVPYKDALQYNSEKAFDKGIASLTDDQIIAYLTNHGDILDNDQLMKNANDAGLPSATDYLTNDNALEQYLKTISNGGSHQNN